MEWFEWIGWSLLAIFILWAVLPKRKKKFDEYLPSNWRPTSRGHNE